MDQARTKAILIGTTGLWVLLGLASVLPAMFSVMMFDAPGSTSNLPTIALAASLMSFPFICAISVFESWSAFRRQAFFKARRWALLPVINLALGTTALLWISFAQGGKFAG